VARFARKKSRNLKDKAHKGERRNQRAAKRADQNIRLTDAQRILVEREYRMEVIADIWLIFRYVLHEKYHFGRERLVRFREKAYSEFESIIKGYVTVKEIDRFLLTEMEFSCDLSSTRKAKSKEEEIEDKAIVEVSGAVLMALIDEFNFKGKKLENFCRAAFAVNNQLERGELTYREMREKMNKVMSRGQKKEVDGHVSMDKKSGGRLSQKVSKQAIA
jgi:hypothetical protein